MPDPLKLFRVQVCKRLQSAPPVPLLPSGCRISTGAPTRPTGPDVAPAAASENAARQLQDGPPILRSGLAVSQARRSRARPASWVDPSAASSGPPRVQADPPSARRPPSPMLLRRWASWSTAGGSGSRLGDDRTSPSAGRPASRAAMAVGALVRDAMRISGRRRMNRAAMAATASASGFRLVAWPMSRTGR